MVASRSRIAVSVAGPFLAALFASTAAAQDGAVLMIVGSPQTQSIGTISNSFQVSLAQSTVRYEVFVETIDPLRFPTTEYDSLVASYLEQKYADRPLGLIVGINSGAFIARHQDSLFPGLPVIFVGAYGDPTEALLENATGIGIDLDVLPTVDFALSLQPDAERLVVINGGSPAGRRSAEAVREQLGPYSERLDISFLTGQPLQRVLDEVARLPKEAIVLFLSMVEQDAEGRSYYWSPGAVRRIATASSAPVYGVYGTHLGSGIVGGCVQDYEALGADLATLALRVLGGESPLSIPLRPSEPRHMADWRELQRWGLDEARLPEGTAVLFREPSAWERYRGAILAAAGVVLLQALLIVLLSQRARSRRVERALQRTEGRYRSVVQAQPDLICRYLPDTTLTFVNDACCRHHGRSSEELLGTRLLDILPESERAQTAAHVQTLLANGGSATHEQHVTRSDGEERWIQWVESIIADDDGSTVEIQRIGRDLTSLKQAEIESERQRDQITHLMRVAVLGELTGSIAHELGQPLAAMLSNAEAARSILDQEPIDIHTLEEILDDIVADDVRAGQVIARLRNLLRGGATDFSLVDLDEIVDEALALAEPQLIRQSVTVTEDLSSDLPPVRGDRVQLQQVLLNLLVNARDAMSSNRPSNRRLTVSTACREDGSLVVSVSDNGPGLSPESESNLFQPFYTTKEDGLGLGLSICRSIISAHGGRLAGRNNSEGGATFEFTLPAAEAGFRAEREPVAR